MAQKKVKAAVKSGPGTREYRHNVQVAFPADVAERFRRSCKSAGFSQTTLCRRWVEQWMKMTPAERIAFYHGE